MEKPSLSTQALARIKAARLEAGADLLTGLDTYWRGIGMGTKSLREHDPHELMPLFERYAEKQFDAEAKEWLACFPDPDAYSLHLILPPMDIAVRICPGKAVIPDDILATDWKTLYRTIKASAAESGRKSTWTRTHWATWPGTAISPPRGAMSIRRCRPSERPSSAPATDTPPPAQRRHTPRGTWRGVGTKLGTTAKGRLEINSPTAVSV